MDAFICTACGTQYTPSSVAPRQCVICEEERQYVPPRGQTWTTLAPLTAGHFNSYRQYEPGVIGIGTQPQFAIGQRALVVCTPNGNVLWDCISMLDPATIALIGEHVGSRPLLLPVPFVMWRPMAFAAEMLPTPPITRNRWSSWRSTMSPLANTPASTRSMPSHAELRLSSQR